MNKISEDVSDKLPTEKLIEETMELFRNFIQLLKKARH